MLKTKFGIDIHFQKDHNGEIRGYGIVDHSRKMALDGSKVMRLSELIDFAQKQKHNASPLDKLRCHAKLQGEDVNGYLCQLAVLRITHEDATELTNRIMELTAKSTGSITLPLRQSDYAPEQVKAFTSHQCTALIRLIPRGTSSTHSANRELEVGKQSRYDHIDSKQSGSQMSL